MKVSKNAVIYEHVKIGKDPIIEDFAVLGKRPVEAEADEMELVIGDFPIIRSGTIIYAGSTLGNNFQTGDVARIREKNKIGNNVSVGSMAVIERECDIKDNVRIHSACFIPEYTVLEEGAWIGPGVIMTNVLHPPCPAFKKYAPIRGKECLHGPIVKKNAVIGAGAVIMPSIVIGKRSLVGAGSVVTEDVPPEMVAMGNPARITRKVEELECPVGFYKKGEVYSWRKK